MAKTDSSQSLKRCYIGATTSSRKERRDLFLTVLIPCLQQEDISDGHLKAIAKIIAITLHRYQDRPSQYVVEQTLEAFVEQKGTSAAKALLPDLIKLSQGLSRSGYSSPLAHTALILLRWTCIILEKCPHKEISELPNYSDFLEAQWLLVSRVCAAKKRKLTNKAYRLLRKVWKKIPKILEESMERIVNSETHQLQSLCFLGICVQYLEREKEINKLDGLKSGLLDKYLKLIVSSKTMPPLYVLEGVIPFLKNVTHDEFKSLVLPAMEKGLLRNPEAVIEAVGCLLSGLSIDLSQYAEEIAKCFSPYIHSTHEIVRSHAVKGFEKLANQCSDPGAVEKLIVHIFAVLKGSDGKLSIAEQRLSVVSALSAIHNNSVGGKVAMEKLATVFLNEMTRFLEHEAHEGILVEALNALKLWSKHFVTEVPTSFVDMLKKGLSAKVSTYLVRTVYFQVAATAFSGNTLYQAVPLIDLLLQHVEKVKSQSYQAPVVTEALCAATLLADIATLDDVAHVSKIQSFWSIVLDCNKLLFTSEKFLTSSTELGLQQLLLLMDGLFANHADRLTPSNTRVWYRALVIILFHSSWKVRHQALKLLKNLLNSSRASVPGTQLHLLTEFRDILNQQQKYGEEEKSTSATNLERNLKRISPKRLLDALNAIVLTNKEDLGNVSEELCFEILIDCHHEIIVAEDSKAWIKIISGLGIEGKTFVKNTKEKFLCLVEDNEHLDQAHLSALETIIRLSSEDMLPDIISKATEMLKDPGVVQVTAEEYGIMNTPEGEVYDKTIIESAKKPVDSTKNVKRESKTYSYKEQKLDMELREELKKKKGVIETETKPQLSKKQLEMLEEQSLREKQIRDRLKQVEAMVIKYTSLVSVAIKASPNTMAQYVPHLIKIFLQLRNSPLSAPIVVPIFIQLKDAVFQDGLKYLGNLIANVTIRLYKPACELISEWWAENLNNATKSAIEALHAFISTRNVYILMTYTRKRLFAAPTFAYCLPLLRMVLKGRGSLMKGDEKPRQDALQLISAHSKLRSQCSGDAVKDDEDGPALLPREEMISVLSEIIVEAEGHNKEALLQKSAAACLIEVCNTGSGDVGCTIVEPSVIVTLLNNLLSVSPVLRQCSLEGLHTLKNVFPEKDTDSWEFLVQRILLAKFDVVEDIGEIAARLWEEADLEMRPGICYNLLDDIVIPLQNVRVAASYALSAAVEENEILASDIKDELIKLYEEKSKVPPQVFDSLGRVASTPFLDIWESRAGIALGLEKIAEYIPSDEVEPLFKFYVPDALGDRNEKVRKHMLDAAVAAVNEHGKEKMEVLLRIFEEFIDSAPDTSAHDVIRQSVVILLGSLAKHLDKTDPKVKPIFSKLVDALSTPSQQVQEAVASCLPPLCLAMKDETPDMIKKLLEKLLNAEKYGERRGAAYGLAGIVKGLGILALKQQNIIATLTESIQDKKNFKHREGALFAFETLCCMLGRLFEPYVVHLLPHLLLCFGDGNQYIREAADETAKAVMRNLSAHGVKLVLPSLLKALEEDSWRTKTGSVELLGAMAFCAPKQLSSCLPNVVPRLIDVLADSHLKVQKAGQQALRQIGGVIRNPEILEIASIILDALTDPANKTVSCLQALLSTSFVHFIDAPSLALIMPCLERAMGQRSTETKKMSAQILGNMYALTDQKDLAPYLPAVIPGLKKSLLDPSPEVRGVSAHALGAMVRGMGEGSFDDLLPWLLETLTSENSSVDRSGAAQGLAEVLHGLGPSRLEELMPDVIETTSKTELAPHVREGYLMLYIYLPSTFGEEFAKYIGDIIPPILTGLADESEYVRDTSLKAGQRIISAYSETAVSLFLPQLEEGLFDENWRIRYSSVQLLGDLLFRVSGVTGKMTTVGDEDDNFGTAHSTQAIMETLGAGRRNRVLAGLYMGRSDIALSVRQASLHVWKVVVQNTARTLREILPTLFSLLLGCLASTSYDKRQVAARTLGDLVRKLGERVLPEIIPILEKGLDSERDDERQGVCIGLTEIMSSTSRDMVIMFEDSLISTVRRALLDPLPEVREAAANTFDELHDTIGPKALDGILPHVLKKMEDEEYTERALDGLRNVMSVKSRVVLPYLVPKLTSPPENTKALAILSAVAGEALTRHLGRIIPAMFNATDKTFGTDEEQEALDNTKTIILSVEDDNGVTTIVDELLAAAKHNSKAIRRAASIMLCAFCGSTKVDYSQFISRIIQGIFNLMNDSEEIVYVQAWKALDSIIKHLDPSEQMQHLGSLRKAMRYVSDDVKYGTLPGFCIPRQGITPLLPVYREGILNGTPELKEQAAELLGDAIKLTSPEALKPSVLNVTGPLIRILGDRFGWNVKVAIISTLALLLEKVGITLKPFLPQLQTTFIKALNDKTLAVRQKAAYALKLLTALHSRVDSLFTEIRNGVKNNEDSGIRETILKALRAIILTAGSKMGEAIRKNLLETLIGLLGSTEDGVRVGAGGALGALCTVLSDFEIKELLTEHLLDVSPSMDWTVKHGRTVALSYALFDTPNKLHECSRSESVATVVLQQASADRIPICMYGVHSLGHLMMFNAKNNQITPKNVTESMKKALQHSSNEVKMVALQTIRYVGKKTPSALEGTCLKLLLPELILTTREKNTGIKAIAESTICSVLRLREGDSKFQDALTLLGGDTTSSLLQDVRRTSLNKQLLAPEDSEQYPFDPSQELK